MKKIFVTICLVACFVFGCKADSVAYEQTQVLDGVAFKSTISVNNTTLKLKGLATLSSKVLFSPKPCFQSG